MPGRLSNAKVICTWLRKPLIPICMGTGRLPILNTRTTGGCCTCSASPKFTLIADVTVINVALPTIGEDLGLDGSGLTWVVTAYTLFFGSLLLLGGRLADAMGKLHAFPAGLTSFTAASIASGLAVDGGMLIAVRSAQGVGAALMSPAAMALLTALFHGPDRDTTLGSPTLAPKAPTGSSRPSPTTPTASATPATSAYAPAARPPVESVDTSMPANFVEPAPCNRVGWRHRTVSTAVVRLAVAGS